MLGTVGPAAVFLLLQVGQLLATPGAAEGLVGLLQQRQDATLASEAAWVMTYLTAGSQGHMERLVQAGLVAPLVDSLIGGERVPTGDHHGMRSPANLQVALRMMDGKLRRESGVVVLLRCHASIVQHAALRASPPWLRHKIRLTDDSCDRHKVLCRTRRRGRRPTGRC